MASESDMFFDWALSRLKSSRSSWNISSPPSKADAAVLRTYRNEAEGESNLRLWASIFIRVSEVAFCKKKDRKFYLSRPQAMVFDRKISNFILTCNEGSWCTFRGSLPNSAHGALVDIIIPAGLLNLERLRVHLKLTRRMRGLRVMVGEEGTFCPNRDRGLWICPDWQDLA